MNPKKYFIIGLFVLTGFLMLALGCIFFGGGELFAQKLHFETYFESSVSGLDVGSAVKFRGVRIGSVDKIHFAANKYDPPEGHDSSNEKFDPSMAYIRVVCSLDVKNYSQFTTARLLGMIKHGLRVKLESQPLTGVSIVAMDFYARDVKDERVLSYSWTPEYTYIPSQPSTMQSLMSVVQNLSKSIAEIDFRETIDSFTALTNNLNGAVSKVNLDEISGNANKLLVSLEAQSSKLGTLLDRLNTESFGQNLHNISENVTSITDTLKSDMPKLSSSANKAINDAQALFASLQSLISALHADDVSDIMESLNRTSAQLEILTKELREKPSRLIFDDSNAE